MIIVTEYADIPVPGSPMRTFVAAPKAEGRYPGVWVYSDIFQITPPLTRWCVRLASYGFVVAAPEIYRRIEPAGTSIPFDDAGRTRGLNDAAKTPVAHFDEDCRGGLDWLSHHPNVAPGKIGVVGFCIGGHLAFRAAMNPDVLATACFYATDIHKGSLGQGMNDDSLHRAADIQGELLMIWGRQDPHIPLEGRLKVLARLNELDTRLSWHEVNGAHAFMRDEGLRYDPELAHRLYGLVFDLFHRKLAEGDLSLQPVRPS